MAVGSEEKEAVRSRAEVVDSSQNAISTQEAGEGTRGTSAATGGSSPHSSLPTAPCLLPTGIEPGGNPVSEGTHRPCAASGSVILLSAEDDVADTIRPRLEAAGGDPDRVVILKSIRKHGSGREGDLTFSLSQDLAALEAAIKSCQDVRLVILDPVSAYLAGVDSHSNAGMREVLAPLRGVAERTGVAVVAISHLTKRAEASVMYRAMGSLAFVAAARAVWVVGPDRETAGRMLFLPVKCNLAGGVTGMAYRIVPSPRSEEVPVLSWEAAPVAMTAEEALDAVRRRSPTRREEAAGWLAGLLAAGPVASKEVEERAWEAGFSRRTLFRAKEEAGVVTFLPRYHSAWMWRLPNQETPPASAGTEAPAAASIEIPSQTAS